MSEKNTSQITKTTAKVIGVLFFVPNWWLMVLAVKLYWEWFVWTSFGWPPITMLQAFAIVLLRRLFSVPEAPRPTRTPSQDLEAYIMPTVYALFLLVMGWIVRHAFFPSAGPMFWGGR